MGYHRPAREKLNLTSNGYVRSSQISCERAASERKFGIKSGLKSRDIGNSVGMRRVCLAVKGGLSGC